MEAVETQVHNPPSPETIWALLKEVTEKQKETARQIEETKKETDRQIEENDRRIEESKKENDPRIEENNRQMKEYNKRFGDFTRRFGEVVEYMIAPNLCDKFREMGYDFSQSNSGTRVEDYTNNIHFEIDVKLENGDKAMLVEVKTKLTTEHVNEHIERLEKMRKYADLHGDKRSFLGAVAGVVITSGVKDYALRQGFFVVEPSGETFTITPPDNKPKEW
jgi:hypothetical protein